MRRPRNHDQLTFTIALAAIVSGAILVYYYITQPGVLP